MRSRLFRILSFGGLAAMMGVAGVWGSVAALPAVFTAQAQVQESGLGLDPENDPVVFTTKDGLEIKKSNAQYSGTVSMSTNRGYSYSQDLRSYYYFTMGTASEDYFYGTSTAIYSYSNQPVNWIILGRGSSFTGEEFVDETSPAGIAILNDEKAELRNFFGGGPEGVVQNDDIPDDCVLVISERIIEDYMFDCTSSSRVVYSYDTYQFIYADSPRGNRYRYQANHVRPSNGGQSWSTSDSIIYQRFTRYLTIDRTTKQVTNGNNFFGFSQDFLNLVEPQQLYTYYSNGSGYNYQETPSTDGGTWYTMFPLACKTAHTATYQNFCIEDYMPNASNRVARTYGQGYAFAYWLRSGSPLDNLRPASIEPDGSVLLNSHGGHDFLGYRPAMVVKFNPDWTK